MSTETQQEPRAIPPGPDPEAGATDADPEPEPEPEPERRPGPESAPDPGPGDLAVEISDTQTHLAVDHQALAQLVRATLASEGVDRASISVAVVDDATIRTINRRHLDHDWPTDVISFGLSDPDDDALTGALVVSAEMAATTARAAGVPAWDELALYLVHGLLHLCGHDDSTPETRRAIRRREGEVLAASGLSNTFSATGPSGDDADQDPGRETGTPTGSAARDVVREAAPWSA
jgi:probable rRNA maturation factor